MAERRIPWLIIGNGAAGITAAETLRAHDPAGEIVLVSAENLPMYSRPGLAYVLTGEIPLERLIARTPEWYAAQRLTLLHGSAIRLDPATRRVILADGRVLAWERLLIATGARATPLTCPGHDLHGVVFLDTWHGTRELLQHARAWRTRRAVVVGGGITALELAEGLAALGLETRYLLRGKRLWPRVFNAAEGDLVLQKMRAHAITIQPDSEIAAIEGDWRGRVRAVQTTSGERIPCELVGVGIGVRPQIEWLRESGLALDQGILVDERLQANLPGIFAAGDCARVYDPRAGRALLDILWPSAVAQGRAAALNMLGHAVPYRKELPFNAALLFGLHLTVMGQINPDPAEGDGVQEAQSWSRGSSELWFTFPRHYDSAWSGSGSNSLRLALAGNRLAGAVVIGDQRAADALRELIAAQREIGPLLPHLHSDHATLQEAILRLHAEARGT